MSAKSALESSASLPAVLAPWAARCPETRRPMRLQLCWLGRSPAPPQTSRLALGKSHDLSLQLYLPISENDQGINVPVGGKAPSVA